MKCSAPGCKEDALMAISTSRPNRDNLYSTVFYDNRDSKVHKKAQHYCRAHGKATISELIDVLVH